MSEQCAARSAWERSAPLAFTTPEEIARDATPERDPFDAYVVNVLAPRLRAAGVQAVGLSLCFPGQLQPAFAFGLKLRRELPGVHLTIGGPAITQLLIRLRGPALAAALGPFDTAVVYVNASTQFTDGAQFGLGAEIIDSTQKTIARGPVGLEGLTSGKWIVLGTGQIRT